MTIPDATDAPSFAEAVSAAIEIMITTEILSPEHAHMAGLLGVLGSLRAGGVPWPHVVGLINGTITAMREVEQKETQDGKPVIIFPADTGKPN